LLPLGKEDHFKGQIDVINKKAVVYSDNDQRIDIRTCRRSKRVCRSCG
jgi:hypothetical protein